MRGLRQPDLNDPMSLALPRLINAIGRQGFLGAVLESLRDSLRPDHVSLWVNAGETPTYVGSEGALTARAAAAAANAYFQSFYKEDPGAAFLREELPDGGVATFYMRREEAPTLSYRRLCYEGPHLLDRLSVLHKTSPDRAICINLYRSESAGAFGDTEFEMASRMAPALGAAATRHCELMVTPRTADLSQTAAHLRTRFQKLTRREAECAAGMIAGLTAAEIAEALGIKPTSVITHRKHAYERIGATSLRHLLALYYNGGGDTSLSH